jgi:uncharacterized protein (TIGR02996 family)
LHRQRRAVHVPPDERPADPAEERFKSCSAEFLYTVRHGEIRLDNCCEYDSFTFDIPNGHYRVTLHAIDWSAETPEPKPGETLPSYVVRFEPVADPSEVNPVPWPPRMDGPEPRPFCDITKPEPDEPAPEPLEDEYRLLVENDVLLLPGDVTEIKLPDYDPSKGRLRRCIVAPSDRVPTVAALADSCGAGKVGDAPWSVGFRGAHLVTVTKTRKKGKDTFARFQLLDRPASKPRPKSVAELKAAFARYARTDPKGLHVENLEFQIESLEASQSPQKDAWWLLSKLPLARDERNRLALLSLAEQVDGLLAWLKSPDRKQDKKTFRKPGGRDKDFLRAIIENPTDDPPRLAYADWLHEQGDPRGEFIRVQCELEPLDFDSPQRDKLWERSSELFKEYGKEWTKPYGKPGLDAGFRRGFVASLGASAKTFLKHAEALRDQGPLEQLRVESFDPKTRREQFEHLAACPTLTHLRTLQLSSNEVDDEEVAILAKSPFLTNLRGLIVVGGKMGPKGMIALANSLTLANLTSLLVPNNPLTEKGAIALAASRTLRNLQSLALSSTGIGDAGLAALAGSSVVAQVKSLDVRGNYYTDPNKTDISQRGVAAIADSPHFSKLESLDLTRNPFGDAGALAIAKSPHLKNLKKLDLSDCAITHVGAKALATAKGLVSLEELDLGGSRNTIDYRAAEALAKSPRLKKLNLFMNTHLSESGKQLLRKRFGKGFRD